MEVSHPVLTPQASSADFPYFRYSLSRETIEEDLTIERPKWIMSAYGPGRDAPTQLFGGYPMEQSPEEIRVMHYIAMACGNPQQSVRSISSTRHNELETLTW